MKEMIVTKAKEGTNCIEKSIDIEIPELIFSSHYIPFICHQYKYFEFIDYTDEVKSTLDMLKYPHKWPRNLRSFYNSYWAVICAKDHKRLALNFDYSTNFSEAMELSPSDVTKLKIWLSPLFMRNYLLDIENSTTHQDVKYRLNTFQNFLICYKKSSIEDAIPQKQIINTFMKYLTTPISSDLDEGILYRVLKVMLHLFKVSNLIFIVFIWIL